MGYDPLGGAPAYNPTFGVRYVPRGGIATTGMRDVVSLDYPSVEIWQTVHFNKRGSEPFSNLVADLVLAAAEMRPGTFPLR